MCSVLCLFESLLISQSLHHTINNYRYLAYIFCSSLSGILRDWWRWWRNCWNKYDECRCFCHNSIHISASAVLFHVILVCVVADCTFLHRWYPGTVVHIDHILKFKFVVDYGSRGNILLCTFLKCFWHWWIQQVAFGKYVSRWTRYRLLLNLWTL